MPRSTGDATLLETLDRTIARGEETIDDAKDKRTVSVRELKADVATLRECRTALAGLSKVDARNVEPIRLTRFQANCLYFLTTKSRET